MGLWQCSQALNPRYALAQHVIITHQVMAGSGSCCLAVEAGAVEVLFSQRVYRSFLLACFAHSS
jgi:hypothetical protein